MVFQVGPGGALVPMGTRAVADFRKRQQAAEKMESIRHEQ